MKDIIKKISIIVVLFMVAACQNKVEIIKVEPIEYEDYYTVVVINEFQEDEDHELNDYIIQINNSVELENHSIDARNQIDMGKINITEDTFRKENVWYVRLYGDKNDLNVFDLKQLEVLNNNSANLVLESIGVNEFDFTSDEYYCYIEYVLVTNKEVERLNVKYLE